MNNQEFLSFNIFIDRLDRISINKKYVVSTLNPFSYLMAEKDIFFKEALLNSNILLPDGQGIVWAVKLLYGKKIQKIAGYDIFIHLMQELEKDSGSCFFFGTSNKTLGYIKLKVNKEFPSVTLNYYSPPFKENFSDEENKEFVSIINSFKPDVLFVGMSAPKQEKWVYKNKNLIDAPVIASIGAVFDFFAGNVKRPSDFWIKSGLEWFIRLLQEPRRLWKRNFIATPQFIFQILKYKFMANHSIHS